MPLKPPSDKARKSRDRLILRTRDLSGQLRDAIAPHAKQRILPPPARSSALRLALKLNPIARALAESTVIQALARLHKHLKDHSRGEEPDLAFELAHAVHQHTQDLRLSTEAPVVQEDDDPLNSLSFDSLADDIEDAFKSTAPTAKSLTDLTVSGEQHKVVRTPVRAKPPLPKKSPRPGTIRAHKPLPLPDIPLDIDAPDGDIADFLNDPLNDPLNDEHDGLFDAFDQKREPPAPPSNAPPPLLPSSDTSFEDSGLFQIFVDETFEASAPEDDFDLEIDIEPIQKLSDAEAAYLGFVDHLNRILRELFDHLETALIQARYDDLIPVARQLNRVARLLDFVSLEVHLPLLSYLHAQLPVSFKTRPASMLHTPPEREVLPEAIPAFKLKIGELLSCLVILVGELAREIPGLDRERFERGFLNLYESLNLVPTEPSRAAPIHHEGEHEETYSQLKLASIARLTSDAETRVSQVLSSIEDALVHGQTDGYYRASRHLLALGDSLAEKDLTDLLRPLIPLASLLRRLQPPAKPASAMTDLLNSLIANLGQSLPRFNAQALLDRARTLGSSLQFDRRKTAELQRVNIADIQEHNEWKRFRSDAGPDLDTLLELAQSQQLSQSNTPRGLLLRMRDRAREHNLTTLSKLFDKLVGRFERSPEDALPDLEELLAALRAMPPEGIPTQHVETLAQAFLQDAARTAIFEAKRREPYSDPRAQSVFELITHIDRLSKRLDLATAEARLETLQPHAEEARELAAEARDRKLYALAVATEVVAELIQITPSEAQRSRTHRAAIEANDRLSQLLDEAIHLDPYHTETSPLASSSTYFLHDTDETRPSGMLAQRAAFQRAEPLIDALKTHAHKLDDPEVLADVLSDLAHLTHYLTLDTPAREAAKLADEVLEHPTRLTPLKPRIEKLHATLQHTLSAPPHPPRHPSIETFCQQAFVWVRRLHEAFDNAEGDEPASHWLPLVHDAVTALTLLARESLLVPFIAVSCELRAVHSNMSTIHNMDIIEPQLEHALYWLDRILWAYSQGITSRSSTSDDTPPEVEALIEAPLRVASSDLIATLESSQSIQSSLAPILELAQSGPFKLATAQGKQLFEDLESSLKDLSHALKILVPDSVDAYLGRIIGRLVTRANAQGKGIKIAHEVRIDASDPQHLPDFAPLFAAAEVLSEGIIDLAFTTQATSPRLTLLLDVEPTQRSLTLEHNGGALTPNGIRTALASVGVSPQPHTSARKLITQLITHHDALLRLSEGPALAVAASLLGPAAHLDLENESGLTRIRLEHPLT